MTTSAIFREGNQSATCLIYRGVISLSKSQSSISSYNMEEVQQCLAALLLLFAAHQLLKLKKRRLSRTSQPQPRRLRKVWSRPWLLRRELYGDYENLLAELHKEDQQGFRTFIRIPPDLFEEMVRKITPAVMKQDNNIRKALPVGLKLAVTLRFLATGNSYTSLGFSFRTSKSAICLFVPLVCKALIKAYKSDVMKCPTTPAEWTAVAQDFSSKWNYHHCLGALDGMHVAIKKPPNCGSLYYNYKKFHSIILMALADAQYRFLYVDIGAVGGAGDAGTWLKCQLHKAIEQENIGFPDRNYLPNDDVQVPFHLIADDAFALKTWLLKPFSHLSQLHHERVFNYRLSRARRVVENAFGILQMRWRVFQTIINLRPATVQLISMCACVLHNLILKVQPPKQNHVDREDENYNLIPGSWRQQDNLLPHLLTDRSRNPSLQAKAVRDYLAHYYCSPAGSVPWQDQIIYPRGRPEHVE